MYTVDASSITAVSNQKKTFFEPNAAVAIQAATIWKLFFEEVENIFKGINMNIRVP